MKGLKINCLYAYGCNTAKMLNLDSVFKAFLTEKADDQEKIKTAIRKLDYFPKLTSIAKEEKKDIFSEFVAHKYWFERHTRETLKRTILLREKVKLIKEAVNILLESIVCSGRILKWGKVSVKRIVFNDKFYFSEEETVLDLIIPLELKKRDIVSLHIGKIREKISEAQEDIILNSNEEALQEANKKIAR